MENMKFTSSNLDNLINQMKGSKSEKTPEEKYDMKNAKMMKFANIIKGVARKYSYSEGGRLNWIEHEDLEQDLWERVLRLIDDCDGIENVDEELVAKVCWNKAVDRYRYYRRRYDSKAQYIEGSDIDDTESQDSGNPDYFDNLHSEVFVKGIDLVLFKEVIDQFPIGSKERKYVVMKMVNAGLIDVRMLDPWDQEVADIPETEDEEGYIRALGYKSHSPGSWTCKKRVIRTVIHEFIGC